MILPDFAYINLPMATHIIHLKPPFLIGRLYCCKSVQELQDELNKYYPKPFAQLPGFNIAIVQYRCLTENHITEENTKVINGMLSFFSAEKLIKSKNFYEKFKIVNNK